MRVHKLAKEYGIKSTEFVDIIQDFGVDIKSHLSTLDEIQVATIKQNLAEKEEEPLVTSLGIVEPLEDSGRDDEETDTGLSFGQQALARATENDEDIVEIQEVEVEKPRGFWGWLGSLFT
jgi:ribosomal protein S13